MELRPISNIPEDGFLSFRVDSSDASVRSDCRFDVFALSACAGDALDVEIDAPPAGCQDGESFFLCLVSFSYDLLS